MKKIILPSILAAILVPGLLSPYALAQFSYMHTVHSGVKTVVNRQRASEFQGNMIPYSIKPLTNPKNGTVTIERGSADTKIFYQSKKDFVGADSFQFVRVSDDKYGGTYTVAVTVK
jgi:hypothetical protein